jgi:hypothetical protein
MKFSGTFNFQGEVSALSTEADTESQARQNFCYGLSRKYGVTERKMKAYFNGQKDNYSIKKEE